MRRHISICFAIVLITLGLPAKTYAATDGCPDMWVIDTTQYPNIEIENAKLRLGKNMVVTEYREYSPIDNSWSKMPPYNAKQFPWINEVPQRVVLKIEVKDCPSRSFIFSIQPNTVGQLSDITTSEWAAKNPNKFNNFKSVEEWVSSIAQYKNYIIKVSQSLNNTKSTNSGLIPLGVQSPRPGYMLFIFNRECGTDLALNKLLRLKQGTICQLGIGFEDAVFERFEIQNGSAPSSITCIKGKATKKISGTNPKCPKGYKKAS